MKAIFLKFFDTEIKGQKNQSKNWLRTFMATFEFGPLILFFFVFLLAIAFQNLPVIDGSDQYVRNSKTFSLLKAATNDNHTDLALTHSLAEGQEVEEEVQKDNERSDDSSNFGSNIDCFIFLKNHSAPSCDYAGYVHHVKKDFQILYCSFLI